MNDQLKDNTSQEQRPVITTKMKFKSSSFDHTYRDNPELAQDAGRPVMPQYIRPHELENDGKSIREAESRCELTQLDSGNLDKNLTYIWTRDLNGKILIAEEEKTNIYNQDGRPKKLGHPSLTGGNPSRISGELLYDHNSDQWIINNRSGRYGEYSDRTEDRLMSVRNEFEKIGIKADIDYKESKMRDDFSRTR